VPRCGNPTARLATQNAARPASPLLFCSGRTDHVWIGTLGAVGDLQRRPSSSGRRVAVDRDRGAGD
jgi:hypothetical protein